MQSSGAAQPPLAQSALGALSTYSSDAERRSSTVSNRGDAVNVLAEMVGQSKGGGDTTPTDGDTMMVDVD